MFWVILVVAVVILLTLAGVMRFALKTPLYRIMSALSFCRVGTSTGFLLGALDDGPENINAKCRDILRDCVQTRDFEEACRLADENFRMRGVMNASVSLGGVGGGSGDLPESLGGFSDMPEYLLFRRIQSNDAKILKRFSRVSRKLKRDGVELSAEELSELTLTVTGRDVMESAVAIARACEVGSDIRNVIARRGRTSVISHSLMLFLISLWACASLVSRASMRIGDTYLPRLDAALAKGGALAGKASAASGSVSGRFSRVAMRRAGKDMRAILRNHRKILLRRQTRLTKVAVSVLEAVEELDRDAETVAGADAVGKAEGCSALPVVDAGLKKLRAHLKKPMARPEVTFAGREDIFREISATIFDGDGAV
jgi:hypothetical protein